MRIKIDRPGRAVRVSEASPKDPALCGAALALAFAAWTELRPDGALLRPRGRTALATLAEDFRREYLDQAHRWSVALLNRGVREEILARMLRLTEGAGPVDEEKLAPAASAEIDRLLREAEARPRDPLGIASPWRPNG